MNKDLYFVCIIADAFQQPVPKTAIEGAFEKILNLGQLPEYKQGFRQFKCFMAEVNNGLETFFEHLDGIIDWDFNDLYLEIIIERNGENIYSIPVESDSFSEKIQNIKPGQYEVRINTGRTLWQEELTERDLVWTAAFPETDMALAADTGDHAEHLTREIKLLEGELILRVIPELDSGCIELEKRI
jgi:hypothetical protein